MSPFEVIDGFVTSLGPNGRRLADGEWGITVDVEGWSLDVGMRVTHGVVLAQAMVLGSGQLEDVALLRANRRLDLVSFGLTESGEVWVKGAAPLAGLDGQELDRLLAVLVRAAGWARAQAAARARSR